MNNISINNNCLLKVIENAIDIGSAIDTLVGEYQSRKYLREFLGD